MATCSCGRQFGSIAALGQHQRDRAKLANSQCKPLPDGQADIWADALVQSPGQVLLPSPIVGIGVCSVDDISKATCRPHQHALER